MKKLNYTLLATAVTAALVNKTDDSSEVIAEKTFNVADIPAELNDGENSVKSLAAYGLSKLLQDRTSSVDAEGKLEAMEEVFALLKGGEWRQRKEGGAGKKAAIDPIFAQAIAEIKSVSVAAATIALQGMDADQRKALRQVETVKAKIAEVREAAEGEAADLLSDMIPAE